MPRVCQAGHGGVGRALRLKRSGWRIALRAPLLHQLKGAADLYGLGVVGIAGEQLLQQLLCFVALAFFRQRPRAQEVVFDDVRVAGGGVWQSRGSV